MKKKKREHFIRVSSPRELISNGSSSSAFHVAKRMERVSISRNRCVWAAGSFLHGCYKWMTGQAASHRESLLILPCRAWTRLWPRCKYYAAVWKRVRNTIINEGSKKIRLTTMSYRVQFSAITISWKLIDWYDHCYGSFIIVDRFGKISLMAQLADCSSYCASQSPRRVKENEHD